MATDLTRRMELTRAGQFQWAEPELAQSCLACAHFDSTPPRGKRKQGMTLGSGFCAKVRASIGKRVIFSGRGSTACPAFEAATDPGAPDAA